MFTALFGSMTKIQNLFGQELAKRSQFITGSYIGNGVYTSPTQINIGFKPKAIFYGFGMVVSSKDGAFEAKYRWINGIQQSDGYEFQTEALAYGNGNLDNFTGLMIAVDDVPVTISEYSDRTAGIYGAIVLTASYSSGIISIKQDCYTRGGSYPSNTNLIDARDAEYQFNANGTTYYYIAIG